MQNIATFLHIIVGAVRDNAAAVILTLALVAVLATLVRVVWDLAAWEQRQHDRHEAETGEAVDADERMAA